MNLRHRLLPLLFIAVVLFAAGPAYSQEQFNLKPGAKGKICLGCHAAFQDKLKSAFVHTPVRIGECTGCHSPHTSSHGKLLAAEPNRVCYRCHKDMVPDNAVSSHRVVVEGNCVKCHDPHASSNRNNLLKAGNELCFGCHKEMGEAVGKVKFKHPPVENGCLNCHDPHASTKADFLLRDGVPSLCVKCHQTNKPLFTQKHMNYPVASARCTTCHNPHGSNKTGILYDTVHPPVAQRMCGQCHEDPNSKTPFATKKAGFELCRGCHSTMINDALAKNKLHWPVLSKKGCLNCHNPHASSQAGLLKEPMVKLCGTCHADTIRRQEQSVTKHPPVQEGNCTACHQPHSSDNGMLLQKANIVELCGTCHDWQKHSTHPVGEKYTDPRNKNQIVQCLSCHRAHGTQYKTMIPFPTVTDLCIQCHEQFKR